MPILVISGLLGAAFALLGLLIGLILIAFGVRGHSRRTIRITAGAYVLFLPLVLFVALPLLASYLVAHAGTRPQDRNLALDPGDFDRPFRTVEFAARDGARLSGWYLEGDPSKPAILFAHGLFRDRREVLERVCRLNQLGYPGLVFDLRSHGASEKRTVSLGFIERQDMLGAFDLARERLGRRRVALAGVSMGAVAAFLAAAEIPEELAGLIADSPFQSLDETIRRHTRLLLGLPAFPFDRLFVWNLTRLGGFSPGDLDLMSSAGSLTSLPVLLVYGEDDRRMPPLVAGRLHGAIPSPEKHLLLVPEADHGAAFRVDPDGYIEAVVRLLAPIDGEEGGAGVRSPAASGLRTEAEP